MIFQSSRAWHGGSKAFRTRWTRRSVLVNVPSFSAKEAPGRTTSASSAVSVRKMSWTTRNSAPARALRVRSVLGSLRAGFSPIT